MLHTTYMCNKHTHTLHTTYILHTYSVRVTYNTSLTYGTHVTCNTDTHAQRHMRLTVKTAQDRAECPPPWSRRRTGPWDPLQ